MKLVFMGTAAFAVPSLGALSEAGHELVGVFTQPDRRAGRGQKMRPSPIKEAAMELDQPIHQPDSLKTDAVRDLLTNLSPDLIVVVAYGKIIPRWLIDLPTGGVVNVHGSILPRYRGAAPVNWAIANGETRTGVCTMQIAEGLDTGPVYLCEETDIDPRDTAPVLSSRLAAIGAPLLIRTLEGIEGGTLLPKPQDEGQASLAPRLTKQDGAIEWSETAQRIHDKVRAFLPWPSVTARLGDTPFKILASRPTGAFDKKKEWQIGTIIFEQNRLKVTCGCGSVLELLQLQAENRGPVTGAEFANGMRLESGGMFASIRDWSPTG